MEQKNYTTNKSGWKQLTEKDRYKIEGMHEFGQVYRKTRRSSQSEDILYRRVRRDQKVKICCIAGSDRTKK